MRLRDIPQITQANYRVDVPWSQLESWLERHSEHSGPGYDLNPPYQREHVWTDEQRTAYVEFCLRGGVSGRDIYWNAAGWMKSFGGVVEIVDGKQRLTAVRMFIADEIPAFGLLLSQYEDRLMMDKSTNFSFHINDLETQAEVIQWYLDLNYRGTPHTEEELSRVRELLKEAATDDN